MVEKKVDGMTDDTNQDRSSAAPGPAEQPPLDSRVARLKTPEDCEQFAKNVQAQHPDLAKAARRHGVELRSLHYGAKSEVEREALRCIYAFEEARSQETGRRARASRTWQSIVKHGIIPTVEKVVSRKAATEGYDALVKAGLEDFTFEAVVLKFQEYFSAEAIERAKGRLY
jgi:hypothetical protein